MGNFEQKLMDNNFSMNDFSLQQNLLSSSMNDQCTDLIILCFTVPKVGLIQPTPSKKQSRKKLQNLLFYKNYEKNWKR